jgi:2-keto-3-deoxy-6-phosphogluconate aldolase
MKQSIQALKTALQAHSAVKIIAGIANFDLQNVLQVARAAEAAGAHAVDIAARPEIVKAVREVTSAAIFASSVEPQALADAVAAGADVAELGNFDALYDQGLFLGAEAVLKLAEETVALVAGKALISITVPGHLTLESQIHLAAQLEALGVDMIQTEGVARVLASEPTVKSLSPAEKEEVTLRNTRALVKATRLPVMTASGITAENAALAFEAGASAIGIGAYVNQAKSETEMAQRAEAVMANRVRAISQVS